MTYRQSVCLLKQKPVAVLSLTKVFTVPPFFFFFLSKEQPVVAAHGVCGSLPDPDSCAAAASHITNERHAQGDGESLASSDYKVGCYAM